MTPSMTPSMTPATTRSLIPSMTRTTPRSATMSVMSSMSTIWSRSPSEGTRVAASGTVGLATGVAVALASNLPLALLIGWTTGSGSLLIWIWLSVHRLDADATASAATAEDSSRTAVWLLVIGASAMSLAAVVVGLHRATTASLTNEWFLTLSSMTTVITAWMVLHTVFVLRYAHLYYDGDEVGGVDFPGGQAPDYRDFAYFGFTVGMTFQVSDTAVTDRRVRRTVLRHSLLSFLFGTAIVATTVNVLAGLVR
jgi:uncharacterized membrane protein